MTKLCATGAESADEKLEDLARDLNWNAELEGGEEEDDEATEEKQGNKRLV